jgi:hypothetical protein
MPNPLDWPVVQEIQPNCVLDDLEREAMAAVAERSHGVILSDTPLAPDSVSVTMPVHVLIVREKRGIAAMQISCDATDKAMMTRVACYPRRSRRMKVDLEGNARSELRLRSAVEL